MGTVSKFEAERRMLDPSNAALDGQARVNAEIFTAVEILGRKLERAEAERDRLARRLSLFESAATVDEKTGKLYLPVLTQPGTPAASVPPTPKWIVSASLMSSAVALFALGLVLFREPAPALTKEQVALLESLRTTQFTQLSPDNKGWKSPESEPVESANAAPPAAALNSPPLNNNPTTAAPAPVAQTAAAPPVSQPALPQPAPSPVQQPLLSAPAQAVAESTAQLPSPTELAKLEQTAEVPKPVVAAAPVQSPAPLPLTTEEKTATADTAATSPQNILIPGEDTIPKDAPKKIARKPVAPAQADSEDDSDSSAKTAATVPTSEGAGGLVPDAALPKKLALLQKRAYRGIPEAQHDLATIYAAGTLVPQDYHRAAFWFTRAADSGVANANYNLGVIYHQGLGVPVDMAKALDWYAKAAELGHPEAMYNLGISYIEGIGTKTDIEKGVAYFKRAAKAGVVQAAYNLGVLYESNFIGPIDTKKASEWYKVAAKAGHKGASDALARLQAGNTNVATDSGDQALSLADKIEPAAGGDEESGEGDSSPVAENAHKEPHTLLADIQRILIKQGLLPGHADGVLSQQTEDAIRASQKKFNLTEDGQPSRELLEKLLQAPPATGRAFP